MVRYFFSPQRKLYYPHDIVIARRNGRKDGERDYSVSIFRFFFKGSRGRVRKRWKIKERYDLSSVSKSMMHDGGWGMDSFIHFFYLCCFSTVQYDLIHSISPMLQYSIISTLWAVVKYPFLLFVSFHPRSIILRFFSVHVISCLRLNIMISIS